MFVYLMLRSHGETVLKLALQLQIFGWWFQAVFVCRYLQTNTPPGMYLYTSYSSFTIIPLKWPGTFGISKKRYLATNWYQIQCTTSSRHILKIRQFLNYKSVLHLQSYTKRSVTPRWPLTPLLLRSHVWLYTRIIVSNI